MTLSLWLSLLVVFSLPSPSISKYEKKFAFRWDTVLAQSVDSVYGRRYRTDKFFYRLAQVYCESGFNPRATSDYGGWKKAGLDTVAGIKAGKGAAGLTQFIWSTAKTYGAKDVNPAEATSQIERPILYNPLWGIRSMSRYMKNIERFLLTVKNVKTRHRLMTDDLFLELVACAGYNTGPARMRDRLVKHGTRWDTIKMSILPEPRNYAEKIEKTATEMKAESRWSRFREH